VISSQPLLIASEKRGLHDRVTAYIAATREKAADGLTIAELVELTIGAMRLAIAAIDELDMAGDAKKQLVTDLAGNMWDEFGRLLLPAALRPAFWLLGPTLRSLVIALAAGAVDALLPLVRMSDE